MILEIPTINQRRRKKKIFKKFFYEKNQLNYNPLLSNQSQPQFHGRRPRSLPQGPRLHHHRLPLLHHQGWRNLPMPSRGDDRCPCQALQRPLNRHLLRGRLRCQRHSRRYANRSPEAQHVRASEEPLPRLSRCRSHRPS